MAKIVLREIASLSRPAWTSDQSTGMFEAYRHKHTNHPLRKNEPIIRDYYLINRGLGSIK
jgi:hypothetical protein